MMKNIVYAYYSKDLSVKVSTAKRAKMRRGEYIGGHVPYGLKKDPDDHHKLVIDPEAAAVVKGIFDAAISGMKQIDIARMLNEKGYETPARYYQRKHPDKKKFRNISDKACWSSNTIRSILQQEMYYGAVVGHKRQGIGVAYKHTVAVPKEEQVIVENMHPGIMTKEDFLQAQKIFKKYGPVKRVTDKTYPLWKKVVCGNCGRAMSRRSKVINGVDYRYFFCPHARERTVEDACSRRNFREERLNEVVWNSVKTMIDAAGDAKEKIRQDQNDGDRKNANMAKKLSDLQRDREKCDADRFSNVDLFMAGKLEKDVYQSRRSQLTRKAESLDKQIKDLEEAFHRAETESDNGTKDVLETMEKYSGETELTQDMVQALIEKVVVYDPEHVEIRGKFSDEVKRMLEE